MHNAILFLIGMVIGGGAAGLAASSLITLDLRPPALALAIAGGAYVGYRRARREQIRRQMLREYLAEPEES